MTTYPFVPKSNTQLEAGQFWSIPLSDGRFGCGRVLGVDRKAAYGRRTMFLAALLDWAGAEPPTAESIAGAAILETGGAHVRVVGDAGGAMLGIRPLGLDGLAAPERVTGYWGDGYPVARAERRFIAGDPPPAFERREVASPLADGMLRPSVSGRGFVQFRSLLTDADFARLADWLRAYPGMTLRAYGSYDGSIRDLEFLRFFPFLRRFDADALYRSLVSLDGLRHLPADLEELAIGATKARLDLTGIARFGELRFLHLEGQTKGIAVVSGLTSVEDLTLRSITLPDLSLLLPMRGLLSLDLKLGGTRDLALLPRIGELRYLELWRIAGLSDVSVAGRLPTLRSLFLQALRQVASLPDLSGATSLRRVHLESMKGLRDLGPLATAPALEEVSLVDMRHLAPEDLRPLAGLPNLRAVTPGLGSLRKNAAAEALVGLPAVRGPFDWRQP
ncbi:MAG: hypothetical protein WCK58_09705 [Chloroflexota bacterium]